MRISRTSSSMEGDGAMRTSFCKIFYVKRKRDAENFIKHLTVPSQRCQCALRQAACDAGSPLPEYVTPLVVVRQWLADFEDKKKLTKTFNMIFCVSDTWTLKNCDC